VRDEPEDEAALRAQAGRGKGGVELVLLTMPEISETIEAICTLAMTVRLVREIGDYDAAAEAIRAELGTNPAAMRMQLRHKLTVMGEVREHAQVGMLLRLYEAARGEMADAA
jgi:hypothetical protein